jgi:K(+)-stimulated pyrophosphate-energized sodium pump
MNLVSVLIAPLVISMTVGMDPNPALRYSIAIGAVLIILASIWNSKRKEVSITA